LAITQLLTRSRFLAALRCVLKVCISLCILLDLTVHRFVTISENYLVYHAIYLQKKIKINKHYNRLCHRFLYRCIWCSVPDVYLSPAFKLLTMLIFWRLSHGSVETQNKYGRTFNDWCTANFTEFMSVG